MHVVIIHVLNVKKNNELSLGDEFGQNRNRAQNFRIIWIWSFRDTCRCTNVHHWHGLWSVLGLCWNSILTELVARTQHLVFSTLWTMYFGRVRAERQFWSGCCGIRVDIQSKITNPSIRYSIEVYYHRNRRSWPILQFCAQNRFWPNLSPEPVMLFFLLFIQCILAGSLRKSRFEVVAEFWVVKYHRKSWNSLKIHWFPYWAARAQILDFGSRSVKIIDFTFKIDLYGVLVDKTCRKYLPWVQKSILKPHERIYRPGEAQIGIFKLG